MNMSKTFKILRYDPVTEAAPHFETFIHAPNPADSVLETLKDIRDSQDPSLACRTQVDALKTDLIVIEPLPNLEIQKDLVVDLEPFWAAYRLVEPYLQPEGDVPPKGHLVEEEEFEPVFQYITCILCAGCYAACPVASRDGRYVGPAALAKLYRFIKDPRDKRKWESLAKVDTPTGAWGCDTVFRCNDVCPKSVRPADGIEGVRRRLVAQRLKRIVGKNR